MKYLKIDPENVQSPLRDSVHTHETPKGLPDAKEVKVHPTNSGGENASIYFVGTATTIM